ncbi:dimethyl sulfoxide reductase anchor subunit family protein [Inmirania thermothiophila]|uniref:DMSO reductase anchor subunit n=1 Tax=Inmirania thermothiophila TaxID=1750597 RepID=A0A3N1Y630_9GAMM|nr:DmsC/YnfH family molybdoenzyme membrane anchor subunit [Inmirania thermothiophila]ROR34266.1 DMSO reductase anchor subunit [Inmirania thermothiophila]
MRPAISVVLLTTLIGAGQGLLLALYGARLAARAALVPAAPEGLHAVGAGVAVALMAAGLAASFFHLGRPARAWRAASGWRTSWLSREVIALPVAMAATAAYGAAALAAPAWAAAAGALAAAAALALYLCTAMIYASIRFLREWHTPLTVLNFTLVGLASGATLAAALAAAQAPALLPPLAGAAAVLALAALAGRGAVLLRNARLGPPVAPAAAIGLHHRRVRQIARGTTAPGFPTREFFHGRRAGVVRAVRAAFPLAAFVLPAILAGVAALTGAAAAAWAATAVQAAGLLLERWSFFAEARHPQNVYCEAVA